MNFLTFLIFYVTEILILFLVVSSRTSDLARSINGFTCIVLVIATFVTRLLGADSIVLYKI